MWGTMDNYGFDLSKKKSQFEHIKRDERNSKIKRLIKSVIIWAIEIAAVVAAAYLIVNYMVEKTVMPDDSMQITLNAGDSIIINRLVYINSEPERFDVVVFKNGSGEHVSYDIKRIIGMPGERVLIRNGEVYINDVLLEETINVDKMLLSGFASDPIVLEKDEYFVLGDNRNSSDDSRFSSLGNIVREDIVGKAWFRLNEFIIINEANKKD